MATVIGPSAPGLLEQLRDELGLSDGEFSAALGLDVLADETASSSDVAVTSNERHRLETLMALRDHLFETLNADYVPIWLREQRSYLGGATPAEAIAQGRADRVEALLTIIDYGMFV